MKPFWIAPVLLFVLGMGSTSALAYETVKLESGYLDQMMAGGHQITMEGRLGGAATVTIDPNRCSLDLFGDPERCTRMAARQLAVKLGQMKLLDPHGKGRRLFGISGLPSGAKYSLVTPRGTSGAFRLIEESPTGRRVIALTRAAPAKPRVSDKPGCKNVSYRAEQRGTKVRLFASGMHPSTGYKTFFTDVQVRAAAPQFRLVCEAPTGVSATVMVPYEVMREFLSMNPVKTITVHDGDGRRNVPVTQVK